MTQQFNLNEALKQAIQTEKDVMDFYNRAAEITQNPKGKQVFKTLAKDEHEHASHFFQVYPGKDLGTFDEFMARPPQANIAMQQDLEKALKEGGTDRKAMEIAMREEELLEKNLRATAAQISDSKVKAVFEKMAKETNHHYQIIESEYARIMGMVHETDINTFVRE
ncbi:ferritin-like domain-containing protein [Trichloromonas sp.]|uniref:ferritin-like domain-containing protein n=1 Tax=Trichloromonas sp. TaxID=3069249 RepID=UPI003D812BF7